MLGFKSNREFGDRVCELARRKGALVRLANTLNWMAVMEERIRSLAHPSSVLVCLLGEKEEE